MTARRIHNPLPLPVTVYVQVVLLERLEQGEHVQIVELGSILVGWGQQVVAPVHPVNIKMERDKLHVKVVHPVNGKIGQDQLNVRMIELLVLPDLAS